jgi:sugar phosphate isomerase/epimerase
MRIGVRAHDVGTYEFGELIKRIKALEFESAQIVLTKAVIGENGLLDEAKALNYKMILNHYGIRAAMLGAYFNPLHSNLQKKMESMSKFKNHLDYAPLMDCLYVGTETGSYNDDQWTYNEKNRTEEAYEEVLRVFKDLCGHAQNTKANVAIEGAFNHVIYSPLHLRRLLDDLRPNNAKVIVDLYNYLNITNYEERYSIFDEAIRLLKDEIESRRIGLERPRPTAFPGLALSLVSHAARLDQARGRSAV